MQHYLKIDEQAKHIDESQIGDYYSCFGKQWLKKTFLNRLSC
jgi:hypothetical protein